MNPDDISRMESAYEEACYICACDMNGLTTEQAEQCDCGHWNCWGCPFGGSEYVQDAYKRDYEASKGVGDE